MKQIFKTFLAVVIFSTVFISCDEGDNGDSKNNSSNVPLIDSSFNGTYQFVTGGGSYLYVSEYKFSGNYIYNTYIIKYNDEPEIKYYYEVRIKSNDHEYEDGRAITCDIEKKIITLYSDSYLNNYRNNNYYGYSDWNLNTPKEVTGLDENGDQDETEYKDIIKLVDDILYLGNAYSKDEDTGYPTNYSTPGYERID